MAKPAKKSEPRGTRASAVRSAASLLFEMLQRQPDPDGERFLGVAWYRRGGGRRPLGYGGDDDEPSVDDQAACRTLLLRLVREQMSDEWRNHSAFDRFARQLRTASAGRACPSQWRAAAGDVESVKRHQLHYLTADEKTMIAADEFRAVCDAADESRGGRHYGAAECSVAGALRTDAGALRAKLGRAPAAGATVRAVLDACRGSNVIRGYRASREMAGTEELNRYLRSASSSSSSSTAAPLILRLVNGSTGNEHSVVMKYVMVDGAPVTVFVDYKAAGFLPNGMANPFRVRPYVDTTCYTSFRVYSIRV